MIVNPSGKTTVEKQAFTPVSREATPSAQGVTVRASGDALITRMTVHGDSNLLAENIRKDVRIFGVTGTYVPPSAVQTKEVSLPTLTLSVPFAVAGNRRTYTQAYWIYDNASNFPGRYNSSAVVQYTTDPAEVKKCVNTKVEYPESAYTVENYASEDSVSASLYKLRDASFNVSADTSLPEGSYTVTIAYFMQRTGYAYQSNTLYQVIGGDVQATFDADVDSRGTLSARVNAYDWSDFRAYYGNAVALLESENSNMNISFYAKVIGVEPA